MDSWGSLPSGILSNNLISFGDFDQCLSISEEIKAEQIRGQYCLSRIPVASVFKLSESQYTSIGIGVCIPSSCNVIDIQAQLVEAMEALKDSPVIWGPVVFSQDQCTSKANETFHVGDLIALTMLSLTVFLVVLSTGYHYFSTNNLNDFLIAFSLLKNVRRLFAMDTNGHPHEMDFLHGIYGITIILMTFNGSYNGDYKWDTNYQHTPLIRSLLLIDTILLAEGFSLVRLVTRKFATKSFLTIPILVFHKYLRLTIVFGSTILFSSSLFKHIGNGPLWNTEVALFRTCRRYWWSALAHIQAYVDSREMCFADSWLLPTCMQLYITSLVLLLPFRKWHLQSACGVLILILICMTGSYFTLHEQQQYYTRVTSKGHLSAYGYLIYEIFHGAVAWLIGILLGYIVLWNGQKKITLSLCQIRIGWTIASLLVISVIVFTKDHHQINNNNQPTTERIVIKLFTRFMWSLNTSWIILICSQGNCSLLNNLLSLKIWRLFSKLRYGIYSIQILINAFIRGTMKSNVRSSYLEKMQYSLGNLIITVVISIYVGLTIEFPILSLENIFWKRFNWHFNRNRYDVERQTVSVVNGVN